MHDTAYKTGGMFLQLYWRENFREIVELGSFNENGTLRDFSPVGATYTGLDMSAGPGVDIIVDPDKKLPLEDGSADVVIASSVFEHDRFFWATFLELARIVRPGGFIYISAPSNGEFHRYPVDCWRFYPDAGVAMVEWAKRNGLEIELIECFTTEREGEHWNDFVAVYHKKGDVPFKLKRFISDCVPCTNITRLGETGILNEVRATEDMRIIERLRAQERR